MICFLEPRAGTTRAVIRASFLGRPPLFMLSLSTSHSRLTETAVKTDRNRHGAPDFGPDAPHVLRAASIGPGSYANVRGPFARRPPDYALRRSPVLRHR